MIASRLTLVASLALLMVVATGGGAQVVPPASRPPAARAQMERQVRQALWQATRRRVGLDDAQMTRLGTVTRTLEPRRVALGARERDARRQLRRELAGERPDDATVNRLLGELLVVQRGRVDLLAEEQRALSAFMTPVQRARYFALQEQFRRRLEQMRRGDADSNADGAERLRRRRLLQR